MTIIKLIRFNLLILVLIQFCQICYIQCSGETVEKSVPIRNGDTLCQNGYCSEKEKRYILYEVNSGEGFNLRRDIYIRIAPLIHALNEDDLKFKWVLVLPPWGRLPHWRNTDSSALFDWKTFFNIDNIREYIPAIELHEYLEEYGFDNPIDIVYQLQHFPFQEPLVNWKEQIETDVPCQDRFGYTLDETLEHYTGYFWRQKIIAKKATCMALRGQASTLQKFLQESNAKSIMFDRAEVILWDHYGGQEWWKARISLRFADHLTQTAQQFLKEHNLSPSPSLPTIPGSSSSTESKYVGVHLRRRDFLHGRQKDLPSLEGAAKQIAKICELESLFDVLLATDADIEDIKLLQLGIGKYSQQPTGIKLHQHPCPSPSLTDGECAIIDQILCSYSSYFIGTKDSTFTFRIYEEREMLGIHHDKTYHHLCPNDLDQTSCKKPTKWPIPFRTNVY